MPKDLQPVKLLNGSIRVSATIYRKLNRKFTDLTTITIEQALQYINEIMKQTF